MKKFKIGEVYRVGIGKGKGDHIKITSVTVHPGDYVKYKCETVFGSSNPVKVFMGGSLFAERLEPVEKLKTGEVYRVGSDGAEKGNIIRILGVCGTPGGGTDYLYETLQGKGPQHSGFYFSSAFARGLELVESERKIVITTDGKTTTAKLYDGRKTIREAKAVCSDSDTFDFNIGAFLAVERLTGCLLENISLTTGRPKPKTLRDVVAEREPDKIDLDHDEPGGVKHCPHHYDYLRDVKRKPCSECSTCDKCWSQPYTPKEEAKPEPPKPKTLRDVVAEREPDKIDPDELGGVKHCPHHYDYLREVVNDSPFVCPSDADGEHLSCRECWDRPYTPKEEAKPEPPKPKTLPEWAAEQIIDGVVKAAAESLRNQLRKRITNEKTGGTNHE